MTPRGDGILVVGDALLDRDVEGDVERLSPDAPVPVLGERHSFARPGGAALTASLVAETGCAVTLVCPLADDEGGDELRALLDAAGVATIVVPTTGPTPEKIRFLAEGRSLLRLDRGGPPAPIGTLPSGAARAVAQAAVVVVSDYGRGMTACTDLRSTLLESRRPIVWDPHPSGTDPVPGATLVTPNLKELNGAFGPRRGDRAPIAGNIRAVAERTATARQAWKANAVAATLGERGALLVDGDGPPLVIPAAPAEHGDPCGAGDRFVAEVAFGLAKGSLLSEAVTAGVAAAAAFVAAGGVRSRSAGAGSASAGGGSSSAGGGSSSASGGTGSPDAEAVVRRVRADGGTVVVAGGCFDLLHAGHVHLLESARRLGDCLIVAMNSDVSVRRLKGSTRPVVTERDRAALLNALGCVDAVVVFDEDSPANLLGRLQPDVFAKGGDYGSRTIPEAAVLARWGGQAVVLPYLSGRSTTGLLDRVGDLR